MIINFKLVAFKYGETKLPEAMVIQGGGQNTFYDISLLYFLIQTSGHNILVDAGCDDMPGFDVKNFIKPYELLQTYGLSSKDITDVIITHAHYDHIQAVKYYKNATIYIQEQEYENGSQYIPKDFNVKKFNSRTKIADILNIIKIGGHSKGSSVVRFEYNNKKYVLVGDECYNRICFEKEIPSGSVYSLEKNMKFIREYRKLKYTTILFHENNILQGKYGWIELI